MIPNHIVVTPSFSGNIQHGRGPICVGATNCSNVVGARHNSLAAALSQGIGLPQLWIDDDVLGLDDPAVEELFRIQKESKTDIVVGWYPKRGEPDEPPQPTHVLKPGGFHGDWSEILKAGFGCILIMPWVWKTFYEKEPFLYNKGGKCPAVFASYYVFDHTETGEDYAFCIRARKHGFRIVAANNVSLIHHNKKIELSEIQKQARLCSEYIPQISTFVNAGGKGRPAKTICQQSIANSDLDNVTWITKGNNITDGFVSTLEAASKADTELVLLLEDDVSVDPKITEKILDWEVDSTIPWLADRFGAAALFEPTADITPQYTVCGVLTTPNGAKWMYDHILPYIKNHINISNEEILNYIRETNEPLFDIVFWNLFKKADVVGIWGPTLVKHEGNRQSTWNYAANGDI
jgi:hypothetical protein